MSEATRDVVVRVSVTGNKVSGFPDFEKMTTAADGFMKTVESGMKILQHDSKLAVEATNQLAEGLRNAASIDLGDLGLGDARAAVEQMTEAHQAATEAAIESAEIQTEAAREVETAVDEMSAATEAAAKLQAEAAAAAEAAMQEEAKLASDTAFKKIALVERLAAHQRKAAKEVEQQEKAKSDAYKKAAQDQQAQMFAATGALAAGLAAGTQFVATIQLIAGQSPEIEELARQFAKVQGIVAGIAAGTQAFNSINQGLVSLQAASAAASAQLTATGASATFTQGALIRLAPAAATAQAALGPLGIAIAGVSLAVVGVQAVANYFSDEMPEGIGESQTAVEKMTAEIERSAAAIDRASAAVKFQNSLFQQQLELKNLLSGVLTGEDIQAAAQSNLQLAATEFSSVIQKEIDATSVKIAKLKEQEKALVDENIALFGNRTPEARAKVQQNSEEAEKLRADINRLSVAYSEIYDQQRNEIELTPQNAAENLAEFRTAVEALPEELRGGFKTALDEFQASQIEILGNAYRDSKAELADKDRQLADSQRQQDALKQAFTAEADIAARLTDNPEERDALNKAIDEGKTVGQSFDAVRGALPERLQQDLQQQFRDGTLVKDDLKRAIQDASDIAEERKKLNEDLVQLVEANESVAASRREISQAVRGLKDELAALQREIRDVAEVAQQL